MKKRDDRPVTSAPDGRYERGLETRREVLGAEYVDRALQSATPFTQPIQELVTEYCWGAVWTRPGLDRRTRSLINVAMLTALNRPHELAGHVRGALRNGCTEEEIQETLLQAAIYCGMPAGLDSFRVAASVLEEERPAD
jgi:4-carboxymuconolactone decarboxylase